MIEFLTHIVLPIVKALFLPFDLVLGWITIFGSIGALVAVGALTGVAVNLFQKYCSNQTLLGRRRADLDKLKLLMSAAKQEKDTDKIARLSSLTGQISSKYALESLKPALYSVPVLCILAMWVGARLCFEPVRPGDVVETIATFEDGASGFAHVVPNEGLTFDGAAIMPVTVPKSASADAAKSPQALWKIRAEKTGDHTLLIRHGDDHYTVQLPVYAKAGHPPEQAAVFRTESPSRDRLLSLEFKLHEPVESAWWNLKMQGMGIYLLASLAFGLALRRVMGIQ
ncbi:MAG: hypothetical protein WCT04_07750 [Planctomycetota bacterium]